jgi:hypothetical protein
MNDGITITIQDAQAGVRARCEAWEGSVHLTFLNYSSTAEEGEHAPSLTPDGAKALAAVLVFLAGEANR